MRDLLDHPSSAKEARILGEKFYYTRVACKNGHHSLKRTNGNVCLECERQTDRKYKNENRKLLNLRAREKREPKKIATNLAELKEYQIQLNKYREETRDTAELLFSRAEAKESGSRYYFTGKPCKHGHISKRFTDNATCYECHMPRQRSASSAYHHAHKHEESYQDKQKNKRDNYRSKPQGRIADGLRTRIRLAIKSNQKTGSAVEDLGCSIDYLIEYIESLWVEDMSWDNYGLYGWHIDHIIPLSSFDLEDREQFLKACHYTNLQPLWAKDNLSKSNKI